MKIAFAFLLYSCLLPVARGFGFGGILFSLISRSLCSIVGLYFEAAAAATDPWETAAEPPLFEIVRGANAVQEIQDPQATADSKAGVWYLVVGTDGFLAASICTGNSTRPDGSIDGFRGNGLVASGTCQDLWSVVWPEPYGSSENKMQTLVWLSTSDKPYYFFMYSTYPEEFVLTKFKASAPNEKCSTAVAMELNEIVEEETFKLGDGDVWYSFAGTGELLAVSYCTGDSQENDNDEFDSNNDHGADCEPDNINYLTSSDIHGGNCGHKKPTVYFQSAVNETYFVQVGAFDTIELLGHLVSSL